MELAPPTFTKRGQDRMMDSATIWRNAFRQQSYESIPGCKQVNEDVQEVM
jgi:hypothetical protein